MTPSLSWLDRVPIRFSILLIQLLHSLCTVFPHPSCDPSCDYDWVTLVTWHFLHSFLCSKEKEKKKKRNINNDLAILPSHDTTLFLSFLILRNFSTTHKVGQPCCLFYYYLLLSILLVLNFLAQFPFSPQLFPLSFSL